ncbi:hypothetical protein AKJ64_04885 [candidate division MSBL1 archaeon SCGC-AAA259E17]|uniref:Uncharacterized protein n=1 Tax=candidate division MSBL1 archaeon SCGC-AAA259E17 TaxID=1698263 RepID=A0A133UAF8_9EURY|nr:hypothetical protein AKJ64_04885 [candidate division MSBL1 archaeon SCGC-AAA259E17]
MLRGFERTGESECELCGKESKKISDSLPLCLECIREKPEGPSPRVNSDAVDSDAGATSTLRTR